MGAGLAGCLGADVGPLADGESDAGETDDRLDADEWPMFRRSDRNAGHNPRATGPGPEPSLRWAFETGDSVWSSPVVADGRAYVGSYDGNLYAVDVDTGEEVWRFETDDRIDGTPAVVDGVVYVGSGNGTLYALDAGVDGDSEDSRVNLGTLGHHHEWAVRAGEIQRQDDTVAIPGFGPVSALSGFAGAGYLLYRRLGTANTDRANNH